MSFPVKISPSKLKIIIAKAIKTDIKKPTISTIVTTSKPIKPPKGTIKTSNNIIMPINCNTPPPLVIYYLSYIFHPD